MVRALSWLTAAIALLIAVGGISKLVEIAAIGGAVVATIPLFISLVDVSDATGAMLAAFGGGVIFLASASVAIYAGNALRDLATGFVIETTSVESLEDLEILGRPSRDG